MGQETPADFIPLILHLIVFFTGVPLNTWIILRILLNQLYAQPTYLLLLNLAISDLLVCLLPVFLNIVSGFLGSYSFGGTDRARCMACKAAFLYVVLNFQTVLNLSLISLDRFAYFRLSIKYYRIVTREKIAAALAVDWTLCLLLGIPPLAGYGDVVFATACGPAFSTPPHVRLSLPYIAVGLLIHLLGLAVLVVTNGWVIYIGFRQIRSLRVKPEPKLTGNYFERRLSIIDVDSTVKQFKLFQIFGAILLVHFATILPSIVLVGMLVASTRVPEGFYDFVLFSLFVQATLHPLVEAFFTPELKKVVKTWCCRLCRKRRPSESSEEG